MTDTATKNHDGPAVECVALTKTYGDFTALDSLDLRVEPGQILGYIGPNGAGKTTTIKLLVGLARPTSGECLINGLNCTRHPSRIKYLVGYMPDTFGAYDNMRVREYLDFFGAAFRIPRKQRQQRIDECLDLTGAGHMRDLYVESLSHGMKQRIGIARCMLHDPPVLILDEPANGLDPQARIDMRQTLLTLAEMGKALIVTSHILPELSRICDVVAILTQGKLRAFGTLDQIMASFSQKRIIEVQLLEASDCEPLKTYLQQALGDDAEGDVTASPTESEVRMTTSVDDAKLAKMLAGAIGQGLSVLQWREVPLDLEDAFLEVTGQRHAGMERADGKVV